MRILKLFLLVTLYLSADFSVALKSKPKILNPDKAFKISAVENGNVIETKIVLADKVHISDESLKYKIVKPKEFELDVLRPKPHMGDTGMIHSGTVIVKIPISDISSKVSGKYTLSIELQGCSDDGICYNTINKEFEFETPKPSFFDKMTSLLNGSNAGNIAGALEDESSLFIVLLFFVFGLLLALTPCIFPMIPILSSIIVSQSGTGKPSAMKGFFTSLVYVLSMAITYTIVGVLSALIGVDLQSMMQNPWTLAIFGIMFFLLALSLFGYYELQLPSSWQSKINSVSEKSSKNKGILGTAIMGFLSAFIIGPCVAPPLVGAVMFISQTGSNMFIGGLALFVMSIGMGLPLLLVGIGAGRFMPKPGGWMTKVSQVFGVVMLGLSIFMFAKIVPESATTLLWSLLFIGLSFYMGVFNSSKESIGASKLFQVIAFISLVYGTSLFIGFLSGSSSMLHPFEKFTSSSVINSSKYNDIISGETSDKRSHLGYSIARLEKEVGESDKPVVVDFTKKSCASCRELEEFTFPDPSVVKELKRFTFITVDVTENTDDDSALLKKYGIFGTPNMIFFDKNNNFLSDKTITGFIKADPFVQHLKSIK